MATPRLARIILIDLNVSFYLPVKEQAEFKIKFHLLPLNVRTGLIKLVMNHKPKGDYCVIDEIDQYLMFQPNKALQEINYILQNSIRVIEPTK